MKPIILALFLCGCSYMSEKELEQEARLCESKLVEGEDDQPCWQKYYDRVNRQAEKARKRDIENIKCPHGSVAVKRWHGTRCEQWSW